MKKPIKYVLVLILSFIIFFFVYGYAKDNFDLTTSKTEFVNVKQTNLHLYIDYEIYDNDIITKEDILRNADDDEDFIRQEITLSIMGIGFNHFIISKNVTAYVFRGKYYVILKDIKNYVDITRGELWITNLPSKHAIKSW